MNTKILAVVVVAIVVVAGVAGVLIANGNHSDSNNAVTPTGRLVVYGNANNDDYIDNNDVNYLNKIISGEVTWNQSNNKYADANNDGKITTDDVDLVKKIIKKESCTIYYDELHQSHVATPKATAIVTNSITYPVKCDSFAIGYYEAGYLLVILGLWDRVTYVDDVSVNYDGRFFPTKGLSVIGHFNSISADAINASGVDIFLGWSTYNLKDRATLREMQSHTEVMTMHGQGLDCLSDVVTFGFLFDATERAQKWTAYYDSTMEKVNNAVKDILPENYVSYYVVKGENAASATNITIHAEANSQIYPDLAWILQLPGTNLGHGDTYQIKNLTAEYFINNSSDYIIWSFSANQAADPQASLDAYAEYVKGSKAYENKNVLGVNYSVMMSYYAPSTLMYMAGMLYPGLIDMDQALQLVKDYYNQFDYYGYNEDNINCLVYRMS